jgi:hypothetical protein
MVGIVIDAGAEKISQEDGKEMGEVRMKRR